MKMLLPAWNFKVAPVFDVSRSAFLVEPDELGSANFKQVDIQANCLNDKFEIIKQLGVTNIVCGAISRKAHHVACLNNIHVISFICGDVSKVGNAWVSNTLEQSEEFLMPARKCCRQSEAHNSEAKRCKSRGDCDDYSSNS